MRRRKEAFSYGALPIFPNMRCMQYCNVPLLSRAFRRSILYGTYKITYRLTRTLDSYILLDVPLAIFPAWTVASCLQKGQNSQRKF